MAKSQKKVIKDLIAKIKEEKQALNSIKNPQWKTNLVIDPGTGSGLHGKINLLTVLTVEMLVELFSIFIAKKQAFEESSKILGVENLTFTMEGYTFAEWEHDFKLRLTMLTTKERQKKLERLSNRLNTVMNVLAPDAGAEIELEQIASELEL